MNPAEHLRKIGYKQLRERRQWIGEHREEIIDYCNRHGIPAAIGHFHIARETINRLMLGIQPKNCATVHPVPSLNPAMTPADLANALLDKMLLLKSDNYVLSQENVNLKNRVQYLEGQIKTRHEEVAREFQEKLQTLLGTPGD